MRGGDVRSKVTTVEQRLNRELGVPSAGDRRAAERARDRHRPAPDPLAIQSAGVVLATDPRAMNFAGGGLTVEDGIVTVPTWGTPGTANPDTTGATLAALETEVNQLKALLRTAGILAP